VSRVEDLLNCDDMCVVGETLCVRPPQYLVKIAEHWRMFERVIESNPDAADLVLAGRPIPVDML